MTTTMLQQREFINDLNSKGMRDLVKVIVGGAPTTQSWADQIGADAFGADALDGRMKIDSLLGY
jgi:methanogenic corrinoid protein MtbC1